MKQDSNLNLIVKELQDKHRCHTVILYGSRSRGEETATSDYAVMGIRESGEVFRDARLWNSVYLDLFVYPESKILQADESMLYMLGAKVLLQKDELGDRFLRKLDEIFKKGPKRLPQDEITALRTWANKAMDRIKAGGIEGDFRRAELLPALLEHAFTTQGLWYRGPKESLKWIKINRPLLYSKFETALKPGAEISDLEALVAECAKEPTAPRDSAGPKSSASISLTPIGAVKSTRKEPEDDHWDSVQSSIELDSTRFTSSSLEGLSAFSHVEILFYMHQVSPEKIVVDARHPRNNPDWPKVGIFAQRGKNRPNQIGTTICQIKKVEGTTLHLVGLDAINGTPVLDIKPWVKEFGPRGEVRQPTWVSELMKEYWK